MHGILARRDGGYQWMYAAIRLAEHYNVTSGTVIIFR